MKTPKLILPILISIFVGSAALVPIAIPMAFLSGCAAITPGNDPVVVNAERSTQLAYDTFNAVEKAEYENYSAFKAIDPAAAANLRRFVNNLRAHQYEWLTSARTLTQVYKQNRSAENKANLNTALAVLASATAEATHYLSQIPVK